MVRGLCGGDSSEVALELAGVPTVHKTWDDGA